MPSKPLPHVLCVEDDEDSRELLIALLRHELIEAKAVGTAVQAISSIQTEHFDLYLLDSRLPDVMALICVAGSVNSTEPRRFFSFPQRPMKLTKARA